MGDSAVHLIRIAGDTQVEGSEECSLGFVVVVGLGVGDAWWALVTSGQRGRLRQSSAPGW